MGETSEKSKSKFEAKIGSIPVPQSMRDHFDRIANEQMLTLDDLARRSFSLFLESVGVGQGKRKNR